MKKSIELLIFFLVLILFAGCAGKKEAKKTQAMVDKELYLSMSNPIEMGRYYLENICRPEKADILYGLLSNNIKGKTNLNDFTKTVKGMSSNFKREKDFINVVTLDSFVFDDKNIVAYYLMVYESDFKGVYFVAELNLINEFDNWKIDLGQKDNELSIVPTITQGDVSQLTRRNLGVIKEMVAKKIEGYQKNMIQEKELPPEEPQLIRNEQEELRKLVKKEMVVGKVYFDVGNFEGARESFEKVISYDPDNQEAKDYLSRVLIKLEEQEKERLKSEEMERKKFEESQMPVAPVESVEPEPVIEEKPKPVEKSVEDELFDKCFETGKKLYDDGEYRKAIVQFQKSAGFKPDNEEVKNYIKKCEKAIQITPSK